MCEEYAVCHVFWLKSLSVISEEIEKENAVLTSRMGGRATVGHLSSCRLACFVVRKLRYRDAIGGLSQCEKACFAMKNA